MAHVFSVSELNTAIKEVLEPSFPVVWVRGQVSNVSRPGSGHIYFTLKDELGTIGVAWFKNNHSFSLDSRGKPLANSLREGSAVLCAGRLSVYTPRGTYQLIPELVQEQGLGDLHLQFEALKEKLKAAGMFSAQAKKDLPACPRKVGVITAANGAALQDFLRVAEQYGLGGKIYVYPVHVQGNHAQKEISAAIARANKEGLAQVLVLIRGGGSLEDLWPFNTEGVARAVFASRLPVLTGIGHEVDTSIADLVADKRAATPTHAVQALWPERNALAQRADELSRSLKVLADDYLQARKQSLIQNVQALNWLSPQKQLDRSVDRLDEMHKRLHRAFATLLSNHDNLLDVFTNRLKRIYSPQAWRYRRQRIDSLEHDLKRAINGCLSDRDTDYFILHEKITALDPHRPLENGYALVRIKGRKDFIREAGQVANGDMLDIKVRKGNIAARVTGASKEM